MGNRVLPEYVDQIQRNSIATMNLWEGISMGNNIGIRHKAYIQLFQKHIHM
jgi:hypothetical protein